MRRIVVSLAAIATLSLGCAHKSRDTKPPQEETSADPMAELEGIPAAIDAEVQLVLEPIHEVDRVLEQVSTMPGRLGIEPKGLRALALASLKDGEVAINLQLSTEARAEVEALLESVRKISVGLRDTPERIAVSTKNIVAQGAKAVALTGKLTVKFQAKMALPFVSVEEKARLQEQLATVQRIEADVKARVAEAKSTVVDLPARGTEALAKLTAALTDVG
jgi:hypothetical protein